MTGIAETSSSEGRDVDYWENYYKAGAAPEVPSMFAEYVLGKYAKLDGALIELGCGNGRDAFFFASKGVNVYAVDQCAAEIHHLVSTNGKHPNLRFGVADFTEMPDGTNDYDAVYSRFTLHCVSSEGQHRALRWAYRNLKKNGKLCIETRGQRNELYKKGTPVPGEQDAFMYDGHYRRFVKSEDLQKEISTIGFEIVEAAEETGFAPFDGTDYHFVRVIAQR